MIKNTKPRNTRACSLSNLLSTQEKAQGKGWQGNGQSRPQSASPAIDTHSSSTGQPLPRCRLATSLGTDGPHQAAPSQAGLLSFPPREPGSATPTILL